ENCIHENEASPGSQSGMPVWLSLSVRCLFSFPQMSLGMSGFELSMVVLPLIKSGPEGNATTIEHRVRSARKLLATAVTVMSLYLLSSTLVTTALIAPEALTSGPAANRAL